MTQENNYDDIINYEWSIESLKKRMPLNQRAKIFLPFAALAGYDEALQETLRAAIADMQTKTCNVDDI